MKFSKPPKTPPHLIELLESRNLKFKDKNHALNALIHIGYYRLSGYSLIFQSDPVSHSFQDNTYFEDILNIYNFDRELRLLILDAIERIEVSFRNILCMEMSILFGADWIFQKDLYQPKFLRFAFKNLEQRVKERVDRGDHLFIKSYKTKYSEPEIPPCWMLAEIADFGNWSMIYQNLKPKYQKIIAKKYYSEIEFSLLASWIHAISYLRNLAAHHCRIWNRIMTIKPKIHYDQEKWFCDGSRVYGFLLIINFLLKASLIDKDWGKKVIKLIKENNFINLDLMGFEKDWENKLSI